MNKICDHTSVGILVFNQENKLLLIERAKFPFGFAIPAGHVDGDRNFTIAASRELEEEVGIKNIRLDKFLEGRKENPCRREGGTWHYWELYLGARKVDPREVKRSLDETKKIDWADKSRIDELAERTKKYLAHEITDNEWQANPGLEPVMHEWFSDEKFDFNKVINQIGKEWEKFATDNPIPPLF
jgi:ADP-ribose pyrophosphatase YjhB (NUDIX family)